jgi:hypothetical protein
VDLDSEEHDNAPFSREANAIVERTDELVGEVMAAMPTGSALAIVSDHGFERLERIVNLKSVATGAIQTGGVVVAEDESVANRLRELGKDPRYGIGREIPGEEWARFPSSILASGGARNPAAAFESAEGVMFGNTANGQLTSAPAEIGNHGHWPMRYRSVYILRGPSIPHDALPEFSMKEIAGKLAGVLGINF